MRETMLRINKTKTRVVMVLLAIPLPVLVYITFFYNPLNSVTLPIHVRMVPQFPSNMHAYIIIGLLEKSAFTLPENLTLRPGYVGAWTTQEYSSGQTIQLSAYKNGSAGGIVHNYTLPSVHFRCMETPHRNETHKLVLKSFYLELVPTQAPQSLPTPTCGHPRHWGPRTNWVTFSFLGIERIPLTGVEAFYSFFFTVLYAYGIFIILGVTLLSSQGKMLRDKSLYQPSRQRLDVETQTRYPRDLFARYAEQYPHNPEGVLEWHIHKKVKEGKTREQAIEELAKESK
jgi:hypothetical protein